jgi:hypothetical protein
MKPTILYIKEHSVTGMKYLGKTTNINSVHTYLGSGKYWARHIKKHGKHHVITKWVSDPFIDQSRLVEFATFISEELDIVKSDKWANMIVENGLDGGSFGHGDENISKRPEVRKKISEALTGRKGYIPDLDVRKKISDANKGKIRLDISNYKKPKSAEHAKNISLSSQNRKREVCIHCGTICAVNLLNRWHNNNCKAR